MDTFDLPVHKIRNGYLSDIYFWREKLTLEQHGLHPEVTMQVFQKKEAILCGMDEALAILKVGTGRYTDVAKASHLFKHLLETKHTARRHFHVDKKTSRQALKDEIEIAEALNDLWQDGFEALTIRALHDGDTIAPRESVMHITGEAGLFAHLETLYLGVLARQTKIATNVHRVVRAANNKPVLFFPARFDHWGVQEDDGYAAHIGGAAGVSTPAQAALWGGEAAGTIPHALIAAVGGDTVHAVTLFDNTFPDVNLVALVDFDNDSIGTALKCASALGSRLWGVRLDTSETMVDQSIIPDMGSFKPTGVIPELVFKMRDALDKEGFDHVKIIASGGFNEDKVAHFESVAAPVDAYGVGNTFMQGSYSFTADIVMRNGKPAAKAGRMYHPNDRLVAIDWLR